MTRSKIFIALAAVLGLLLVGRDLYADEFAVLQADDSGPIPPASLPDILKALPRPPDQPASLFQQATQEHSNESPLPDRYFEEDPLLDTPDMPKSGWFTALDLQLAAPHVFQFLYNGVTAGSRAPDFVNLPNRGLDWTLAPRLEIGYQLPSGFGGFSIAYREREFERQLFQFVPWSRWSSKPHQPVERAYRRPRLRDQTVYAVGQMGDALAGRCPYDRGLLRFYPQSVGGRSFFGNRHSSTTGIELLRGRGSSCWRRTATTFCRGTGVVFPGSR